MTITTDLAFERPELTQPSRIVEIRARAIKIPFQPDYERWEIAKGKGMSGGDGHVVVSVRSAEGLVGYGEVGRYFEGETVDGILCAIGRFLGPAVLDKDPLDLAQLEETLDIALKGNTWAKSAVQMAVLDLAGKIAQLPVSTLLGGARRTSMRASASVGIQEPPDRAAALAARWVADGFTCLKVKVGDDHARDIATLRAIREKCGDELRLRIDLNQSYRPDQAVSRLSDLEQFNLILVEQPLAKDDIAGAAFMSQRAGSPVMACESALDSRSVYRIATAGAAHMINIKPGRAGGLLGGRRMMITAEAANLGVCVGTMLELGIATAANLHLAATAIDLCAPVDCIGASAFLRDEITTTPVAPIDGSMRVPQGVGLGVTVDWQKVEEYAIPELAEVFISAASSPGPGGSA